MDYLPVFLDLRGQRVCVIGGGGVAARKADLLAAAGPQITIVSPECGPAMAERLSRHGWHHIARGFEPEDLDGARLVLAATDDPAVNRAVYDAAIARQLPVNVADQPALCSFILPAIVDRSPVIAAVSTGGRSPVLARYVKSLLERQLSFGLGHLATALGRWREAVQRRLPSVDARRRFWETVIDGPIGEGAARHDQPASGIDSAASPEALDTAIGAALDNWDNAANSRGDVYLIGAGPGDPELLTLRGQRLLQRAEVVLYDRLIPTALLDLCRREAELIYVGKQAANHVVSQQTIGELLVQHARAGRRVARLKGGDPFIFGRGGEELEALVEAGIDFQVVPGISAANGCAAYAGIPLTHRDHAAGVSFWTGHMKNGHLDLPWAGMEQVGHTHVFFMSLKSLPTICEKLLAHGFSAATPAAMIAAGTTSAQRLVAGTLTNLVDRSSAADLPSPALLIVGSVVGLGARMAWFQTLAQGEQPFPFPRH